MLKKIMYLAVLFALCSPNLFALSPMDKFILTNKVPSECIGESQRCGDLTERARLLSEDERTPSMPSFTIE